MLKYKNKKTQKWEIVPGTGCVAQTINEREGYTTIALKGSEAKADIYVGENECVGKIINEEILKQKEAGRADALIFVEEGTYTLSTPISLDFRTILKGVTLKTIFNVKQEGTSIMDVALDLKRGTSTVKSFVINCNEKVNTGIKSSGMRQVIEDIQIKSPLENGIYATDVATIKKCDIRGIPNKTQIGINSPGRSEVFDTIVYNAADTGFLTNMMTVLDGCSSYNSSTGINARGSAKILNSTAFGGKIGFVARDSAVLKNIMADGNQEHGVKASMSASISGAHIRNSNGRSLEMTDSTIFRNGHIENISDIKIECYRDSVFSYNYVDSKSGNDVLLGLNFKGICSHNLIRNGGITVASGADTKNSQFNIEQK